MIKRNIKNLSIGELSAFVAELGEKRHRKTQILQWLYQKGVSNFMEMTNMPKSLRQSLENRFVISSLRAIDSLQSKTDKSQRFLFESDDGSLFESVLMDSSGHQTICISSQVGCPLRCSFCRTGEGGFERNLKIDEILNQVLFMKSRYLPPRRRFNVVFMGTGEPLLNMDNLGPALELLNATEAFALGEKRITVSTIGIPEKIDALGDTDLKFSLAVSLNAADEDLRKRIMPLSRDLNETLEAAERFARLRGTRVTLEYVMLAGVNDRPEDAERLSALTKGRPFKINLIPFNEWEGSGFHRPSERRIEDFVKLLLPKAPTVTVRRSQGREIEAACGQLKLRKRE